VELCVVIGKRCRHVAVADARKVIAGYIEHRVVPDPAARATS
jgi:2-keto-4-pentenoate hydratase/2-oxohepta-3-ene-1,7-dioic acid hydratase in catechol pathway